ncbi:response regulator [Reinekea marinisedimentorum]|uniref:Response regulator receiver domain-containing protein n=1 Tax=Reinekea marinisedimentorum TaxID=230495 RepID=A0A4R3I4H8_9GAMM|nr:response regulator [Reinekea marinisedimentorum]TCS40677.1 response regulator receiver domain-containing protein [Reinekea marinisedimentorum]
MSKVLVVDDEKSIANSIKRLLYTHNMDVLTASNGQEALDCIEANPDISVVISDQRMPKMTGSELFARVSAAYPNIRRILITGYTDLESIRAAVNTGQIFRFLLKPWDDDELLSCVEDGMQAYDLITENQQLKDKLITANANLEENIERKTRVLNMNILSLQRYEKIVEQLPIGIVCISHDGMVVLANQQFCTDFDFSSAVEGRPYKRVIPEPMHHMIEHFEPGRTIEFITGEKEFKASATHLSLNNTDIGQLYTIQAVV